MITLAAPYASPVDTIQLPNPSIGDSEQLNIRVSIRRAMDGTIYSNVKTPPNRKFLLDFPLISETQRNEILAFLTTYAGADISYTDWRLSSPEQRVKILTAPIVFREHKNGYAFTLEMITVET